MNRCEFIVLGRRFLIRIAVVGLFSAIRSFMTQGALVVLIVVVNRIEGWINGFRCLGLLL